MEDNLNMFFESLDALDSLELISHNLRLIRPRVHRHRIDDLAKYDDVDFFTRYRLSKRSVLFLLEKIEHLLEFKHNKNQSVPPINQLLCALRYFATGNFLITVADLGGISVATCSRIIKKVANAIVTLREEFIRFPETQNEISNVKGQFYKIAKFPNVLGCIDCTHVKIQSPGGDDAELFRNRKSYMSINVQTISDGNLLIMDVVARWPGSTHDSAIYQNSRRCGMFERGSYGVSYLLGDSGYPLKNHLLTPYLNPSNRGERKYNKTHIKTRNTVERQYGVLKRRFPVLAVVLRLKLETAVNVILACCILHNICIIKKDKDPLSDGSVPNLEELILNGHIPQVTNSTSDPTYGYQRNIMTQCLVISQINIWKLK